MTTPDVPVDRPLDRRRLIRGGAVLAGAAGATVIGAALSPTKAHAVDLGRLHSRGRQRGQLGDISQNRRGDRERQPDTDPEQRQRSIPRPGGAAQGTEIELGVGEIVNTVTGPQIEVNYGDGNFAAFLATGADVTNAYPIQAERVLDTRSAASRADDVVNGSSGPRFDSLGRLAGGKFIDVAVARTEGLDMAGVYLNVTAFRPTGGGYVEVYTPGPRRALPTITFQRQVTATNSVFVAPGGGGITADTYYTVRVYTTRPTHLMIDVLGAVTGYPATVAPGRNTDRRQVRQAKQRARLIKAIKDR